MTCFYQGPADSGGQFMILTETASGPQADAMLKRRGSAPPPESGLIGVAYRQGSIIFSVSVKSADQGTLEALVAEIKQFRVIYFVRAGKTGKRLRPNIIDEVSQRSLVACPVHHNALRSAFRLG
jgi:hypothetical protein